MRVHPKHLTITIHEFNHVEPPIFAMCILITIVISPEGRLPVSPYSKYRPEKNSSDRLEIKVFLRKTCTDAFYILTRHYFMFFLGFFLCVNRPQSQHCTNWGSPVSCSWYLRRSRPLVMPQTSHKYHKRSIKTNLNVLSKETTVLGMNLICW